jgi:transcriptional regulator NrdR family protein
MSVQLPCNNNIVDIIAKKIRRRRASHEISKRYTYSELEHKAKVVVLETGNIHT